MAPWMAPLKQGAFSEMIPLESIGSPRAARSRTIDLESNSMQAKVSISEEKLASFCEKWLITEPALFGSVLRDDFRPDNDIDVLVSPGMRKCTKSGIEKCTTSAVAW